MRNEAKVKENGWEARYYYLRFSEDDVVGQDHVFINNRDLDPDLGVASVCVLKLKGNGQAVYSRGISFWPRLGFRRKAGRNVALGRAIMAAEHSQSSQPLRDATAYRPRLVDVLFDQCSLPYLYLAEYQPELTDYERKLFKLDGG